MTTNESRYEIILYWSDDDQAVIAEVPELPGCAADGETYEEALTNVRAIMVEWIETARDLGREVPKPKGRLTFA
ncbi:MAG: type II toxin-antitoxin system HicB family antitoxin [Planctomycetaceae bacterium]|nr:type II toxin-antitoxin system HicB family antitoxin [Planctomycetaceae bacterium]